MFVLTFNVIFALIVCYHLSVLILYLTAHPLYFKIKIIVSVTSYSSIASSLFTIILFFPIIIEQGDATINEKLSVTAFFFTVIFSILCFVVSIIYLICCHKEIHEYFKRKRT